MRNTLDPKPDVVFTLLFADDRNRSLLIAHRETISREEERKRNWTEENEEKGASPFLATD